MDYYISKNTLNYSQLFNNQNIKNSIYLKNIYNYFNENYSNNIPNIKKLNTKIKKININIDNKFISKTIINNIYKLKNKCILNFKIKDNNINITIFHNEKNLDKFINALIIYIKLMYNLCNCNKDINFTYYLTNSKKNVSNISIQKRNHIFTVNEINSGLSYNNNIIIWRKEEILKVTLHELIHNMNLDYRDENKDIIDYYNTIYNLNSSNMNTFEAYTDFWAIIINAFLVSKLLNENYNYFKDILSIEISFILYQAKKILYLSRINNKDIININKNTNVFSYYIIKSSMFLSLSNTLKYFINNNKNLFKITDINKFFTYLKNLNVININNFKNKNILNTMRMSIISLDLF